MKLHTFKSLCMYRLGCIMWFFEVITFGKLNFYRPYSKCMSVSVDLDSDDIVWKTIAESE